MCEREYVGCPSCYRAADEGVRAVDIQSERISYALDSDGDRNYDEEPSYGEEIQSEPDGFECECGWQGHALQDELVPEDCDCEDCVEPDYADGGDGADEDAIVEIYSFHSLAVIRDDLPLELQRMTEDRSLWYVTVPRWRADELRNEHFGHCITVTWKPERVPVACTRLINYPTFDDREVTTA